MNARRLGLALLAVAPAALLASACGGGSDTNATRDRCRSPDTRGHYRRTDDYRRRPG